MTDARFVYLLWHVHDLGDGEEDEKLLGVYWTRDAAEARVEASSDKPGFVDHPEGFVIARHRINKDEWTEGFQTVHQ